MSSKTAKWFKCWTFWKWRCYRRQIKKRMFQFLLFFITLKQLKMKFKANTLNFKRQSWEIYIHVLSVKMDGFQWKKKKSLEKHQQRNASLWTVGHMQTKQWTETNVSSDYVGVLILAFIFSINSVISFSQIIWLRWYNWWICFITKKVK